MINLLFTGNDKVVNGLCIALVSIVKYCKEPLNVTILTMDLTNVDRSYKKIDTKDIKEIENYIKSVNAKSKIKLVDITNLFLKENKQSVNIENSYSPYAFLRLLADKVKEIKDKVLYLDIDVIAGGNIAELYNINVDDYEYAAVRDYYGKIFINKNYINSGVMLFNMAKVRDTQLFAKCREMVNTKKMLFPDQTALNKLGEKKLYLPRKFNSQRRCYKDDVIRHFCKSIRWYPYFEEHNKAGKKYCEPFSKWFKLFHTLNVKPWDLEGLHTVLNCYKYDNVIIEALKILKKDKN